MSAISLSSPVPQLIQQNQNSNPRLQAHDGEEGSWLSTTFKVTAVILSAVAGLAGFVLAGPIGGIIVTLICGAGMIYLFNCCYGSSNNHAGAHYHHTSGQTPLHSIWVDPMHAQPPHVVVGGGHFTPTSAPILVPTYIPVSHGGAWYATSGITPPSGSSMGYPYPAPVRPPQEHTGVGEGHTTGPRASAPMRPPQEHTGVGEGHTTGPRASAPMRPPQEHAGVGEGHTTGPRTPAPIRPRQAHVGVGRGTQTPPPSLGGRVQQLPTTPGQPHVGVGTRRRDD